VTAPNDFSVTFDLWETLIIDRPELDLDRGRLRYEGIHSALSRLGIKLPLQDLEKAYHDSAAQLQAVWGRNEHVRTIDQIRLIIRTASGSTFSLPEDPEAIEMLLRAYVDPILAVPPKLNEQAVMTLEGMRSRVQNIGLVSNTGRSPGWVLRQLIGRLGILEFFDVTIFSDEVGWRKPDKHIFERAAIELGTDLHKIIHIGDDPEADVWGAKQAGMRAVLFDYPIPEGFKRLPSSLFALSRGDRRIKDSEINPDGRIGSLKEALDFVDSLRRV